MFPGQEELSGVIIIKNYARVERLEVRGFIREKRFRTNVHLWMWLLLLCSMLNFNHAMMVLIMFKETERRDIGLYLLVS